MLNKDGKVKGLPYSFAMFRKFGTLIAGDCIILGDGGEDLQMPRKKSLTRRCGLQCLFRRRKQLGVNIQGRDSSRAAHEKEQPKHFHEQENGACVYLNQRGLQRMMRRLANISMGDENASKRARRYYSAVSQDRKPDAE